MHVREQGGHSLIIINHHVGLAEVFEEVGLDVELDLDGAHIQAPAPVLAKVVEIGEEDLLVLWGLHNQPRALDAAVLCGVDLGQADHRVRGLRSKDDEELHLQ